MDCKLFLEEKNHTITFTVKEEKYLYLYEKKLGVLKLIPKDGKKIDKNEIKSFFNMIELHAKKEGCGLLIIDDEIFSLEEYEEVYEHGYRTLSSFVNKKNIEAFFSKNYTHFCWIKEIEKDFIERLGKFNHYLTESFSYIKKKHPTLTYKKEENLFHLTYREIEKESIECAYQKNHFYLHIKNQKAEIKTIRDSRLFFVELMKRMQKKQRMTHLFNAPSKKHFKEYIKEHILTDQKLEDTIYKELLKTKTAEEIEDYFAIKKETPKKITVEKHAFLLFDFECVYLVLEKYPRKQKVIYIGSNKSEARKEYEERIKDFVTKTIKEQN